MNYRFDKETRLFDLIEKKKTKKVTSLSKKNSKNSLLNLLNYSTPHDFCKSVNNEGS